MDGRFNTLAQQIFQRSFENCSTEEIKNFSDQYPYFAPAHYLLLQKLQPGTDEYNTQYQKAILYYHNPSGFSSFLNSPYVQEEPNIIETEQTPVAAGPIETLYDPEPELSTIPDETGEPEEEPAILEVPPPSPPVQEPIEEKPTITIVPAESAHALTFEPFHTVDYFASQGIKLSQEELPKDQLGKQMKSFTEWLKTMKRLPATELVKAVDSSAERKVENLAEHSLQTAEVVTEAMAEVWLRQGAIQKALDIYNKLSLQNPSKRAYFAAKIDNLKKSH